MTDGAPASPTTAEEPGEFRARLVKSLPRLGRFALGLTRSRDQAEDLVNDTIVRALNAESRFEAGTNIDAWLCTILRNQYISSARQGRRTVCVDDLKDDMPSASGGQIAAVEFSEMRDAISKVSPEHRELLLMVAAFGLSYEEAAELCKCAVGTVKSRLNRARVDMHRRLAATAGKAPDGRESSAPVPHR
jgi:RNA polymerase sigma-70 factor (ECF subfamily)